MIQVQEATLFRAKEIIERSEFANVAGAENTLRECLLRSSARYVAWIDGEPACAWGLIPQSLLSSKAYLWLIVTDVAEDHKFLMVRYSQLFVQSALKCYLEIVGHCASGDTRAKRWLRWLGAEFGVSDGKKTPFTIRRKEWTPLH